MLPGKTNPFMMLVILVCIGFCYTHSHEQRVDNPHNCTSKTYLKNTDIEHYLSDRQIFYKAQLQNTILFIGSATPDNINISPTFTIIHQGSLDSNEIQKALKGKRPAAIVVSAEDLVKLQAHEVESIAKMSFKLGAEIISLGTPSAAAKKAIERSDYFVINSHVKDCAFFQPWSLRTLNRRGTQVALDAPKRAFIDAAKQPNIKALDIGASFGDVVIHAAYAGAQDIHAWELDSNVVEALSAAIAGSSLSNYIHSRQVDFLQADIQHDDYESYDVILMSRVLHLFKPKEIEASAHKLFHLLKPGGILHVTGETAFLQLLSSYVPIFLEKISAGEPWPGYLDTDTLKLYLDPERLKNHQGYLTFFDKASPAKVFKDAGFTILRNQYLSRIGSHEAKIPLTIDSPYAEYRGKESIWLTLRKPKHDE